MLPGEKSGGGKLPCDLGVSAGDRLAGGADFFRGCRAESVFLQNAIPLGNSHRRAVQPAGALSAR